MISINNVRTNWLQGNHREVARVLPYFYRRNSNAFINNLKQSNLLQLKDKLDMPSITLGADPEFILCEKGNPDNIVMFSSEYTGNRFAVSEAQVGADYGLLEFRTNPANSPLQLVEFIEQLHKDFATSFEKLDILKQEAIEHNHQISRIRDAIRIEKEGGEPPSYGGYEGKNMSVWSVTNDIVIDDISNVTLSAYSKPQFKRYNPSILSAGGHIHIGGTFIKCLSLSQLNTLVKKFDKIILPIAESVATEFGELRKTVYGSPGEYRLKEYGIEYRSPSNMIFLPENRDVLLNILEIIVKLTKEHLLDVKL